MPHSRRKIDTERYANDERRTTLTPRQREWVKERDKSRKSLKKICVDCLKAAQAINKRCIECQGKTEVFREKK